MEWVWCQGCGEQVPQHLLKCARHDRLFGVCAGCLKAWETEGESCAVCNVPIAEAHTPAFSQERRGLSHAECGRVALL